MRVVLILLPFAFLADQAISQTGKQLDLGACYAAAEKHSILTGQPFLYRQQHALKLAQIDAGRKPELSLNSRASIQTENVDLGIDNPLFQSPDLPLFQFRLTADAAYTLYDGGMHQAQREQEQGRCGFRNKPLRWSLTSFTSVLTNPFSASFCCEKRSRSWRVPAKTSLHGAKRWKAR